MSGCAATGEASFLLESVEQGRLGRYSFVGCGPRLVSLEEAERLEAPVVGYLATTTPRCSSRPSRCPATGQTCPESRFVVAETLVRFDHAGGVAEVLQRRRRGAGIAARRARPRAPAAGGDSRRRLGATRRGTRTSRASVERAKEHIRAGDAFQIVALAAGRAATSAGALDLYRALRRVNPSPYLFLLELGDLALIGSSPETLVKVEGRRASLNPIAGTTAPGPGDAERLLASEKDRAEHVMLVDLGRNDLSRVCRPGACTSSASWRPSASRTSPISSRRWSASCVTASGRSTLLRACFPAGTVSGAPKVRAMQIISELEGRRRGPYAGAVGYALPGGDLDTCIAIRTIVLHDGVAHLQAGAGIVADSDPSAEHEECLRKLAALETAITLAER